MSEFKHEDVTATNKALPSANPDVPAQSDDQHTEDVAQMFSKYDLTALPVYLFAGMLLSLVMYVTRSTIASMIVHLCYNLFGIFVQAGLSGYCRSTGSIGLLVVILIILLLLKTTTFSCKDLRKHFQYVCYSS